MTLRPRRGLAEAFRFSFFRPKIGFFRKSAREAAPSLRRIARRRAPNRGLTGRRKMQIFCNLRNSTWNFSIGWPFVDYDGAENLDFLQRRGVTERNIIGGRICDREKP
jgi:hypothetical protein